MVTIPVVVGPTGIGKSDLAIALAKELDGEILSCDSRQIYKGMDIGTAKVSAEEQNEVPHHLINIIEPEEEYSAGRWASDADKTIHDILSRDKKPIICGGTFFYLQALRNGFDATTPPDQEFRRECLRREEKEEGTLHNELLRLNPERAEKIHPNDIYRTIRALQIHRDGRETTVGHSEASFELIQLNDSRELLYDRINKRVDRMVENGLLEEFETLLKRGYTEDTPGLKCVGYHELFNYIHQVESLETCLGRIKQNSRKYAKKQLTWLRNRENPRYQIEISELDTMITPLISYFSTEGSL